MSDDLSRFAGSLAPPTGPAAPPGPDGWNAPAPAPAPGGGTPPPPPPGAWGASPPWPVAPPPPTTVRSTAARATTGIPLGIALVGLGGLLVLVGGFLPHVQISVPGASAGSSLVHEDWHVGAAIAVGIGLMLLAAASVVQPRQTGMVGLQGLAGFAALLVGLLDWNMLSSRIDQVNEAVRGFATSFGFGSFAPHASIGSGVWSVIVGGIVAMAGSVVSAVQKT